MDENEIGPELGDERDVGYGAGCVIEKDVLGAHDNEDIPAFGEFLNKGFEFSHDLLIGLSSPCLICDEKGADALRRFLEVQQDAE